MYISPNLLLGHNQNTQHQHHLAGLATSSRSVDPKLKGDASMGRHPSALAVPATGRVTEEDDLAVKAILR